MWLEWRRNLVGGSANASLFGQKRTLVVVFATAEISTKVLEESCEPFSR